jgi:hypothetical protein
MIPAGALIAIDGDDRSSDAKIMNGHASGLLLAYRRDRGSRAEESVIPCRQTLPRHLDFLSGLKETRMSRWIHRMMEDAGK